MLGLQLVNDLHGADLRRARNGAGGKARDQGIDGVIFAVERALDIGNDVHHLAVVLEDELVGDLDRAHLGDAAHVIAAEIEQHQVLGALLGIGQQFRGQRPVLGWRERRAAGCRRSAGW